MLLTEAQAEKVFQGSFESRIRALVCATNEKGWSLVASAEDHVHVIEDGMLVKRSYTESKGEYTFGRSVPVKTLPENDAVGLVAGEITRLAEGLMSGDADIDPRRLISLSRHAKGFMTETDALEALSAPALSAYYEEHKAEIRRGARGNLGELESENKLTYYRRMAQQRAESHKAEIFDSLKSCAESLDRLECQGEGQIPLMLAEFKEQAIRASAIIRHSSLPTSKVAEAADHFSKSLQTASILREYIQHEGK